MKKISILVVIALMAIIYSCGNSEQGSKEQKTDSLATAKQVDNKQAKKGEQQSTTEKEKAELYKYFSKAEIKAKMDTAMKYLNGETSFFSELLKKDGFTVSPEELEKKWGKAKDKLIEKSKLDLGGDIYDRTTATITFNEFQITTERFDGDYWAISSLTTETRGFGFGGIYVGVPECNKAYLLKLFKKFKPKEDEYNGAKHIYVSLSQEVANELSIKLDNNGLIESISYFAQTYVD